MQIKEFLAQAVQQLKPLSETAQLEVQVVLAQLLNKDRSWVLAHPEWELKDHELKAAQAALQKLINGIPLAYITGEREFFGLPFWVDESVLIPRPETELLVDYALHWLKVHSEAKYVLDVGTGSGCIAVSLAYFQPRIKIIGTDLSWNALQVARRNSQRHQVAAAIPLIQSDLCLPFMQQGKASFFDLICANLPYVPSVEAQRLIGEPLLALDGGEDGLAVIERFIPQAAALLRQQGLLLLEIGMGQSDAVERLITAALPHASITFINDWAGIRRVCAAQLR